MRDREFGRLTLPEFWALWERRAIVFKRQIYLHGIVASAVYNVQRSDPSQHLFDATDFIPISAEEAQREKIVLALKNEVLMLKPEQINPARVAFAARLRELGRDDAEELLAQIFEGVN